MTYEKLFEIHRQGPSEESGGGGDVDANNEEVVPSAPFPVSRSTTEASLLSADATTTEVTTTTMTTTTSVAAKLARPNILALHPYRCARDDYSEGVLMDANENAFGPAVSGLSGDHRRLVLERYPDPHQAELKEAFLELRLQQLLQSQSQSQSNHKQPPPPSVPSASAASSSASASPAVSLTPENVFAGVGSDEAIDMLMRIFCTPASDCILTTPPTYGMYKVSAAVNDVRVVEVPLAPNFSLRVPAIIEQIQAHRPKLVFACSPGNPTAVALDLRDMEQLADALGDQGLLVVDEAYVDFIVPTDDEHEPNPTKTNHENDETSSHNDSSSHSNDNDNVNVNTFVKKGTALALVTNRSNVVVLQTLSKAFGLAGIRMGFAVAAPDVIQLMNNVKAPYNVNKLTSQLAVKALKNSPGVLKRNVHRILEQRKFLIDKLTQLPYVIEIFPTDANFILFRLEAYAVDIYKTMASEGVVVRYRGNEIHCSECIRVSVGTPDENRAFLRGLDKAWKQHHTQS